MKEIILRINGLIDDSIVDGPGLRFVIFLQGCMHNCRGCHNPETHDPNGGYIISLEEILFKIKSNSLLSGVTFSGGEPFLQADALCHLAREIKKLKLNIIIYTGFVWEYLITNKIYLELLRETDILIDGRFDINKRNLELKFRGSENQRIINTQESLRTKKICLIKL